MDIITKLDILYFSKFIMKNRKTIVIGLLILVVALIGINIVFFSGLSGEVIEGSEGYDKLEKVKIGYRGHLFYLPAYVAEARGYYEEQGLEVELVEFSSTNQLVEAVINGDIDAAVGGVNSLVPLTIESKNKGLLKIFNLGYFSKGFDHVLVRKDSDIRTLQDLEGKTLSTWPGSSAMIFANLMLEAEGLDGKVSVVQTKPSQQLNALSSGSVDAIFVLEPLSTISEEKGISRVLVESPITAYFMSGMYFETSVFSSEFVNENPETVKKISAAVDDAIFFINSNPNEAKTYYSEFTSVEDSLEGKLPITTYRTSSSMNVEEFQRLADKLEKEGFLGKKVVVDSMFYGN